MKEQFKNNAGKAVQLAKVTAIVAMSITSLVGGYVIIQSDVRNFAIDYAQDQHVEEVKAEALPKE